MKLLSHGLLAVSALALTTAFGAGMGFLIDRLAMPAFIVTLAGMFLARGAAYILSIDSVPIQHPFYQALQGAYWLMPGKGRLTLIGVLVPPSPAATSSSTSASVT